MGAFQVKAPIRKRNVSEAGDRVWMYGWAAISKDATGEPLVDSDKDYVPATELESAAQRAFLDRGGRGAVGQMHSAFGKADLVESFVLTEDKAEAFGLSGMPLGWIVGLTSTDPDVIKAVRSGAMLELSIRGSGRREPVTIPQGARASDVLKREVATGNDAVAIVRDLRLSEVELLSIVDKGASGNDRVRPRIVLVKRKDLPMATVTKARTPQVILAELFEAGKLTDLPAEDKEVLLLAASSSAPAPAPAPAAEPAPKPEPAPAPVEPIMAQDDEDKDEEEMAKRSELAKQNVELSKRVAELEALAKRAELVELVKSKMAYLPGVSVEDIAKLVHEGRTNLGSEVAKSLETLLCAASETIRKSGLFDTAAVRHDAANGGGESGQLSMLAKSIRDKDPKLSASEAILAAGRERPDLWANRAEGRR
jgi:hypothetical protein